LAVSDALLAEVHRILHDKYLWPDEDLADAATELADFTLRVFPTQTIDAAPEDPDDNRVLECAVPAGSRYIATADATLLRLGRYGGIQIMRVADFMALINPR